MEKRKMRKLLLVFVIGCLATACTQYIPHEELDGTVCKDSNGKTIKLEWQEGKGESWRFKYPVTVITQKGDTLTEWRYYQ